MPGVDHEKLKRNFLKLMEESRLSEVPIWLPREGENRIRILPPWNNEGIFYKEVLFHWASSTRNQTFPCRRTIGDSCYICDLADSKRMVNREEYQKLKPRKRFYMNILDRVREFEGIQIASVGVKVLTQILQYFCDPEWGDLTDVNSGRDVIITRSGQGLDTDYAVRVAPEKSPISSEWLDKLYDLDKIVNFASNEEMRSAFSSELPKPKANTVDSGPNLEEHLRRLLSERTG